MCGHILVPSKELDSSTPYLSGQTAVGHSNAATRFTLHLTRPSNNHHLFTFSSVHEHSNEYSISANIEKWVTGCQGKRHYVAFFFNSPFLKILNITVEFVPDGHEPKLDFMWAQNSYLILRYFSIYADSAIGSTAFRQLLVSEFSIHIDSSIGVLHSGRP